MEAFRKKFIIFLSYLLVAALASAASFAFFPEARVEKTKLEELESLIDKRFVGEVDHTALEDGAADGMVGATGDRWSYYIPADEYAVYQEQMENAYVGVGITISVDEETGGFLVMEVTENGPAQEAGVQAGDLLICVNDEDIRGLDTTGVRNRVRGEEGTKVSMGFLRSGEELRLDVERRRVETPVVTFQMLDGNIGYVAIANFDTRCADETISAVKTLMEDGAEKLLFDVRNNPGGYADELVDALDYLLPEGELFRTVTYNGIESVDRSGPSCVELPMAVLVNEDSYSAAEFFAAALQEYEAAIVVGEQTVGKGYFQNTFRFSDGSAVSLSVGKYFTPKGVSLAEKGGITPDVSCPVDDDTYWAIYYGTLPLEEDPQVQAAIDALK